MDVLVLVSVDTTERTYSLTVHLCRSGGNEPTTRAIFDVFPFSLFGSDFLLFSIVIYELFTPRKM